MIGVNVDPSSPAGRPDPHRLRAAGFRAIRIVLRRGIDAYLTECRRAGLEVLGVLARESFADGSTVEQHRALFGDLVDVWQIGNEPDGDGPSSWRMTRIEYLEFWRDCRAVLAPTGARMATAGLCSGNPEWVRPIVGELGNAHAIAVHPYGKGAPSARALLEAYRWISSMGVLVSEWNRPAEEIGQFVGMLREIGVLGAHWFCYSDGMVRGFGLVDGNGVEGPAWRALTDQLKEESSMRQYELVAGFKALAEQLGGEAVVGTPVEPETYWPDGVHSSQVTTRGLFVYTKTGNLPVFLPGASPLDLRLPRA